VIPEKTRRSLKGPHKIFNNKSTTERLVDIPQHEEATRRNNSDIIPVPAIRSELILP
jgi:hypothetical protein